MEVQVANSKVRPVVIYTAIAGGYDDLKPPRIRPENCDFVVFSDEPLEVEGWQVRPLTYQHDDPTRTARFMKLHPHVHFPDYDLSVWVDANIAIDGDLREFCGRLDHQSSVGIFAHPERDCIYDEAKACIRLKKDDATIINEQIRRYSKAGFPQDAGLWETNIVVRRHNDPTCVALMTEWWREIESGSRRDQLSLPVVAKRLGVTIAALGSGGQSARNHPAVRVTKHRARRSKIRMIAHNCLSKIWSFHRPG